MTAREDAAALEKLIGAVRSFRNVSSAQLRLNAFGSPAYEVLIRLTPAVGEDRDELPVLEGRGVTAQGAIMNAFTKIFFLRRDLADMGAQLLNTGLDADFTSIAGCYGHGLRALGSIEDEMAEAGSMK